VVTPFATFAQLGCLAYGQEKQELINVRCEAKKGRISGASGLVVSTSLQIYG